MVIVKQALILLAGLIGAGLGNALVALVAGPPGDFPPLRPGAYLFFTAVGYLAGVAGWALIRARASDPARTLRRLVPIVVVASLLPNVALLFTGTDVGAVVALMVMHVVVAVFAVPACARALPLA
ncbi:DUF6069 family protein [Actinoplanes sp. NPDC051494]|uniref:DUF6069 family protein n=1 Tax=Actinoplanes sp. NPDC051494 TaxID=3363907 RepID=UPI003787EA25